MLNAILIGVAISLVNALSTIVIAIKADRFEFHKANKIIFGTMAARFALSICLVIFLIIVVKLPEIAFVLSFFISGFIFTLVEIFFLNYRSNLLNLHQNVPKQRK